MRLCQSVMNGLYRHIGPDTDRPAGDIGVGAREIGYLFGQYKRLTNRFVGILTGKGMEYGGSPIRTEATGYGAVYFMESMLRRVNDSLEGKRCIVSGSGNVAQYAVEKINQLGGKAVTLSDSNGFIYDPNGIGEERLAWVMELKNVRRGRLSEYAKQFGCEHHVGRPWGIQADLAFPCATQNEISTAEAKTLIKNGIRGVSEGANMPTEQEGIHAFVQAKVLFAPSKAANAGGVAVSGLEMSQNSARITWKEEELQKLLREIMTGIHDSCAEYGQTAGDSYIDYVKGANIAAFIKVADAMLAYGVV
ncbi:MAG: glutamate dehydrogenase, partial [Myxococcales bacterium]|nr:glutamate dehydrogenase [Myxococcales bacterium]